MSRRACAFSLLLNSFHNKQLQLRDCHDITLFTLRVVMHRSTF